MISEIVEHLVHIGRNLKPRPLFRAVQIDNEFPNVYVIRFMPFMMTSFCCSIITLEPGECEHEVRPGGSQGGRSGGAGARAESARGAGAHAH